MDTRTAARHVSAILVLLYCLCVGALLVGGALVTAGVVGAVPRGLGLVALIVGAVITAVMALILRIPGDLERLAHRGGVLGRMAARVATVPQVAGDAARVAMTIGRARPHVRRAAGRRNTRALLLPRQWATCCRCPAGSAAPRGHARRTRRLRRRCQVSVLAVVSYQMISTYLPALPGIAAYVGLCRG
jgi:hypothetical protein